MKEIVFATNNNHKLAEIRQMIPEEFRIISLADIGLTDEIPETAETISGNALLKARYVYERYGKDCFADDTGLEVLALNGAPGVYSARYAGLSCSYADNVNKLLKEMNGVVDRKAKFITVIALVFNGTEYLFEGTVSGQITLQPVGTSGFGYDPVFLPDFQKLTFAEMHPALKNEISHRGKAVQQLIAFLRKEQ